MRTEYDRELEERLVRYCAIDSQSDEDSKTAPSTARLFDMLNLLVQELREIGANVVPINILNPIPGTPF